VNGRSPGGTAVLLARTGFGVTLLLAPGPVLRVVDPRGRDGRAVVVTRVLGARHVVQALVGALAPGRRESALSALVDATHAATCLVVAATDRRRARPALVNAAAAATWGLLTWAAGNRPPDHRTS